MSARSSRAPARRGASKSERGIALVMVVIAIALLTTVATEFTYNTNVDLRLATNQRDEVRAYFLARSAVGLSRLLLKFQRQMDAVQLPNLSGMLGQLLGGAAGQAGAPGAPSAQPQTMSLQLWRMAKIDCYMLQSMVPDEPAAKGGIGPKSGPKFDFDDENPELAEKQKRRKFGAFEGCFKADIADEEEKLNLNKLDAPAFTTQAFLAQLLTTLSDKKYEFVFEKEDANRVKVSPNDVVLAIRDWIDEDEVQSTLNLTGQGEPFIKGFADENYNYDKYEPRYKAKNGRFDSLDELYLVHGVSDRFMAAFRDKLTVYPDSNSRLNINTDDPILLEVAIRSIADPARPDPRLYDPVFVDTLIKKIRAARMFAVFGMSVLDFVNIVEAAGVKVNPSIRNNPQNQRFIGDKSQTFSIKATGVTYGPPCEQDADCGSNECVESKCVTVRRTITAVVRTDDGLGKLLHWKEE